LQDYKISATMDLSDYINHLLNFVAPAAFVAVVTAAFAIRLLPKNGRRPGFRQLAAACFLVSLLVLLAGLWVFGRDGRMTTYAAMVLACGSVAWLMGRAWRG